MAITWKKISRNPETGRDEWVDDGVTHEGLVLSESRTVVKRVMSDIYSDEYYCSVLNPETFTIETVHLGGAFELNTKSGHAVPDLDPDIKVKWDAVVAKREEQRRLEWEAGRPERERKAAEAQKAAEEAALKDPKRGRKVKVVSGRKVNPGTEGYVFWRRDGRLGIALSDERDPKTGNFKDVAWVDARHCEAFAEGNSDEEVEERLADWKEKWLAIKEGRKAATKANDDIEVPF